MSDDSALETLVGRLRAEVPSAAWIVAACGVPAGEVPDLAELVSAQSPEAGVFLDHAAVMLRGLVSTTTIDAERCVGHVRGPILWSETVTAWSSGIGADDVFVCGSPRRDYDIAENRLLKWLLLRLSKAAGRLDSAASMRLPHEVHQVVRSNAAEARTWAGHRYLRQVGTARPTPSEIRKAKSSRHALGYAPALALAARFRDSFHADEWSEHLDEATADALEALRWLDDALGERGSTSAWEVSGPVLVRERLCYRHPRLFGQADAGIDLAGIAIGARPGLSAARRPGVDELGRFTAALAERSGSRPWLVISDRSDAALAVEMLLDRDAAAAR